MRKVVLYISFVLFLTGISFAGDDPSIKGKLRTDVNSAMEKFVAENSVNNQFVIYDAVSGNLLRLKLEKIHPGIVKKGDFYVSCADFVDSKGVKYDIDFLVGKSDDGSLRTVEAVVHSVAGKKRKYHVEN